MFFTPVFFNTKDCDTAGYKKDRFDEISNEMSSMLVKVGWKKDFIEKNTPMLPISGWMGDNLLKKSTNMGWWAGVDIIVGAASEKLHLDIEVPTAYRGKKGVMGGMVWVCGIIRQQHI